jgi:hypothetical protein
MPLGPELFHVATAYITAGGLLRGGSLVFESRAVPRG